MGGCCSSTAMQQLPSIVSPLPEQPAQSAISHHLPPTGLCRLSLLFGAFHFRHPALGPPVPPSLCAVLSSPSAQELWARLCTGVPPTHPLPFLQSELVGQLGSVPRMGLLWWTSRNFQRHVSSARSQASWNPPNGHCSSSVEGQMHQDCDQAQVESAPLWLGTASAGSRWYCPAPPLATPL